MGILVSVTSAEVQAEQSSDESMQETLAELSELGVHVEFSSGAVPASASAATPESEQIEEMANNALDFIANAIARLAEDNMREVVRNGIYAACNLVLTQENVGVEVDTVSIGIGVVTVYLRPTPELCKNIQ